MGNNALLLPPGTKVPAVRDRPLGPHLPRVKRVRSKTWVSAQPCELILRSWNGLTDEENPPSYVRSGPALGFAFCEDTKRNRNRFQVPLDDGGDLLIRKSWHVCSDAVYNIQREYPGINATRNTSTVGRLRIHWGSFYDPEDNIFPFDEATLYGPSSDITSLDALGPQAWQKAKPAKRIFGSAQFVYELKEAPKLLISRIENLKDISNWYLALNFGWKPLLEDLRSMIRFMDRASSQISFLKRNHGKPVRRQVRVLRDTQSKILYDQPNTIIGIATGPASAYHTVVNKLVQRDIWFSGEFVFYLERPDLPSIDQRLRAALFGARVSPADIWNLAPWTWLVDWFANFGTVIENQFGDGVVDRQLSRYAYIMGKTTRRYEVTSTDGDRTASRARYFVTKARRKVDPYGLSLTDDLSVYQLSILTALGLQRS